LSRPPRGGTERERYQGSPTTARHLHGSVLSPRPIRLENPAVMLYAPLRTLICIDSAGRIRLAVDQPGTF
jgi:hypothetical protein